MTINFLTQKTSWKVVRLLLVTIATSFYSYAQEPNEEDQIDILLGELFFNEKEFIDDILESIETKDFIYTNVTYNSNTFFSGRDSGIDQFNLNPVLTYYHSSGFNISISGVYYEKFDPNWDYTNISLGYYNTIGTNKLFHYKLGYTKYFYKDGWDTFTNSLDISIGIRNKKRNLGSTLITSYLFGNDQSIQLVSNNYGKIPLIKHKNYSLKLRPQLNFIVAKQTIALEQFNDIGNESTSEFVEYDIFNLLNTQINLPLTFTTKSWDIGLGYTLNFPFAVATEENLETTGFFNLSIGYLIDLHNK